MDSEAAFDGLLDRLTMRLRQVDYWEKFVVTCAVKKEEITDADEKEIADEFSDEQFAAFLFWRITGVYEDEDEEVHSTHDDDIKDYEDQDLVNFGFAKWLKEIEKTDLTDIDFFTLSDQMMGIYKIGISVAGQSHTKTVDINESKETELPSLTTELPPLTPLSDMEVDNILAREIV